MDGWMVGIVDGRSDGPESRHGDRSQDIDGLKDVRLVRDFLKRSKAPAAFGLVPPPNRDDRAVRERGRLENAKRCLRSHAL